MSEHKCKGCHRDMGGWPGNLYEGLCHSCWRKANPKRSCEECVHAKFGLGEDGETTIKCLEGVKLPLDCYEPKDVPQEGCEKQVLKIKESESA